MASIEELYKKSEFAKLADKSKDKTPIDLDGGKEISYITSEKEKGYTHNCDS